MNVFGAIVAGLVGTVAISMVMAMAPKMGMPKMDIYKKWYGSSSWPVDDQQRRGDGLCRRLDWAHGFWPGGGTHI